jgi:aminopeptidase N
MTLRRIAVLAASLVLLPVSAQAKDPLFPSLGSTAYDVRHYDIKLSWSSTTASIDATTTVTARARQAFSTFSLDLSGLTVSSVLVDGVAATYTREGHKLRITRPTAAGATFTTQVVYSGVPRYLVDPDGSKDGWLKTDVGAIVLAEPQGAMTWFPNNDVPSDKATYDVAVDVPAGFQAVSTGRNTSVVPDSGRSVWHWSSTAPVASYLVTVAIGHYTRTTSTVDGIRYDSFVSTSVPSNVKPVALLPKVVRQEAKWFGPYPFADAGILVDAPPVSYALELQNRPFFPEYASTAVLVHELAHQWFGDSVTVRSWNHIWLNEGFATYAEWLWKASHGGATTHQQFLRALRSTSSWSPAPLRVTGATLFDDAVYTRGAMTLQVLRERVGSKAFFTILRHWAARHRNANGTTHAFKALAEKISHQQLDTLFRDWLYREQRPRGYGG